MKIFVTGDTHKRIRHAMRLYRAITSEHLRKGVPHVDKFDYIIHCGDYKSDALRMADKTGIPVISVYGNRDKAGVPDFDILDTEAGSILVTHGHLEHVKKTHEELYALAEDQGCNCICFGHTHVPECEEENGYLMINPGSPTKPRDGTEGSCVILTADKSGYTTEIVYYSALPPDKKDIEARQKKEAAEKADKPKDDLGNDDQSGSGSKPASSNKKSSFGGFLRKIFNYSDGQ